MKKYRHIWIIILCIALIGSAFTVSLRRALSEQERNPLQTAQILELETKSEKDKQNMQNPALENNRQAGGVAAPGSQYLKEKSLEGVLQETEEFAQEEKTEQKLQAEPAMFGYEAQEEDISQEQVQESADQDVLEVPAPASSETENQTARTGAVWEDTQTQISQETEIAPVISPLTGSMTSDQTEEEKKVSYQEERRRLAARISDLETQIASRWKEDTDETMTSKMNAAEYEYETWKKEMAQTIELLKSVLDESRKNSLAEEQIRWKKESDAKAVTESKRYEGSSREVLEYTKTSSMLTKKRVLQLINTYLEVLQEQEKDD